MNCARSSTRCKKYRRPMTQPSQIAQPAGNGHTYTAPPQEKGRVHVPVAEPVRVDCRFSSCLHQRAATSRQSAQRPAKVLRL